MLDKPCDLEKLVLQMQVSILQLQQTISTVLATNGKQHDEISALKQANLTLYDKTSALKQANLTLQDQISNLKQASLTLREDPVEFSHGRRPCDFIRSSHRTRTV